jgi:RNA polymerase sigma-70 factor (ECF subfamily)
MKRNRQNSIDRYGSPEKAGHDDTFSEIWNRYGKRVSYFISIILPGETGNRDDLFQDIMLKIYEGLPSYDPSRSFEVWAYRIARNRCIDYLRTRHIHEEAHDTIPGRAGDPADECIRSGLDRAIREALDGLAPDDRQIAYLRFFENMRIGDIAASMDMNINTVKTRITAIKRALKSDLEDWL